MSRLLKSNDSSVEAKDPSSYFPPQRWENMSQYDKLSYHNILQNYFVMKSMGLQPKKPWFMSGAPLKPPEEKKTTIAFHSPVESKKTKVDLCIEEKSKAMPPRAGTKQSKPNGEISKIYRKRPKGEMYYHTVKQIPPKEELFVSYRKKYPAQLGITQEAFYGPDKSHILNQAEPENKCQKPFASPLNFETHIEKRRGPRSEAVKVQPDHPALIVDNLRADVNGKARYSCQLCQLSTEKKSHMRSHLAIHSRSRQYRCEICSQTFTRADNLSRHKRIHSVKMHRCPECAYSCHQAGQLKRHLMLHTGETIFVCARCSYKTTNSRHIKGHTRTHMGEEKPYSCAHCSYTTAHKRDIKAHITTTHAVEKPFTCPHCSHATAQKRDLKRHIMAAHTMDRPHSCDLCEYRAVRKDHLVKHKANCHGDQ